MADRKKHKTEDTTMWQNLVRQAEK